MKPYRSFTCSRLAHALPAWTMFALYSPNVKSLFHSRPWFPLQAASWKDVPVRFERKNLWSVSLAPNCEQDHGTGFLFSVLKFHKVLFSDLISVVTSNRKRKGASNTHRSTLPAAAALCGHGDAFSPLKFEASLQQQFNLLTQRPALMFRHFCQSRLETCRHPN